MRELILRLRSERRTIVLDPQPRRGRTRGRPRGRNAHAPRGVGHAWALRVHLFGARLRIVVVQAGASFVNVLEKAGFTDVRTDGETLSIGVDDAAADAR